jgi:hypothetical protein
MLMRSFRKISARLDGRHVAVLATALGTLVVGSFAIGAFAIGRLVVGHVAVKRAKIASLEIGELTVGKLRAVEIDVRDALTLKGADLAPRLS